MVGSDAEARQAAEELARFCKQQGKQVSVIDRTLYTLPHMEKHHPGFPFSPCWTTKGQWLLFSTHPDWLPPYSGPTRLQLLEGAQGADAAALGDFEFLMADLCDLEESVPSEEGRQIIALWRRLPLDQAKWIAWLTVDPQGNWQQATLKIYGWHWRKAARDR